MKKLHCIWQSVVCIVLAKHLQLQSLLCCHSCTCCTLSVPHFSLIVAKMTLPKHSVPYWSNPRFFIFWHSGTLALSPEKVGLDQYGPQRFEVYPFDTTGLKGLTLGSPFISLPHIRPDYPTHLCVLLHFYTQLHCELDSSTAQPCIVLCLFGNRSFSYFAPTIRSTLPFDIIGDY